MRVLLLNQFFHPDVSAVAQLATDLAEDLVRAGHEVTVLAARGGYLGGERLPAAERWRGVRIIRVASTSLGKSSIPRRLADYATFFVSALARALWLGRFDVVLATTAPPMIASIGAALKVTKGSALVYWLQDVYPELAVTFGVARDGSPLVRAFEALSRATLRRSDAVVTLGAAMAERVVRKGVDPARVHVVPNWADGNTIRPIPAEANDFRRRSGLAGKTVVLYSGNMGRGHDMETLLAAARALRDRPDFVFAFVGEGAKRPAVEAAARELPSIRVFPYQPREALSESLSAGDVHVVTQDAATLGLIEPSKLYGVMAAGRPVLFIGPAESEAARTVAQEDLGLVVANGDTAGAVRALIQLAASATGRSAGVRRAFERGYDRPCRTAQLSGLLAGAVALAAPLQPSR